MSLYYDAVTVLSNESNVGGSFKSRLYNSKNLKSSPSHIYALIVETAKWDIALKEVIENAGILDVETKVFFNFPPVYTILAPYALEELEQKTDLQAPTHLLPHS